MTRRTHFAGGVEVQDKRGRLTVMLAGWAVCCSGDRAYRIKASGWQTYDETRVTCPRCLSLMARGTKPRPRTYMGTPLSPGRMM